MSEASDTKHTSQSSDGSQDGTTVAELNARVAELLERVLTLEEQAEQRHPEVSEEILLAIAAACAAYLGQRAVVKQVHLLRGSGWASQGRAVAQHSHAGLHGYRDRQAPMTQIPRRGTT